jgi:hypothetical protein
MIASTALPCAAAAQGIPPELEEFLEQTVRLDRDDLSALSSGRALVTVLDPSDRLEVALFGIVRVDVRSSVGVARLGMGACSWRRHPTA